MNNELEKTEQQVSIVSDDGGPQALIQQAIASGADLDKLEKLLDIQLRGEANIAKKAYVAAMADFKKNPPEIEKDKKVKYKDTKYNHASLFNVTNKINSALSEYGFSSSWITSQNSNAITVTCTITHNQGHSESTSLTAGADTTGSKNAIQAIGSTVSYLQRYTLLALTGLATHDMDDDGAGTDTEYVTAEQAKQIDQLVVETGSDPAKVLAYLKVESYNKLLKKDFVKAITALNAKKRGA